MGDVALEWSGRSVARLTLDRPPVNALDASAYVGATGALEQVAESCSTRALVLTGAGTRVFCAGTDTVAFEDEAACIRTTSAGQRFFETLARLPQPIVGALNGPAIGAGAMIAAECDILIASETVYFSVPELPAGFVGAASHIKRLAPYFKAQRMMLLGEHLEAVEAHASGTVMAIVEADRLLGEATRVAKRLSDLDPLAVRDARAIFRQPEGRLALEGYRSELEALKRLVARRHKDSREDLQERVRRVD
jgi:enoyl-CoA hydratase